MNSIKQVVILAGGKGTRMREMTSDLPKPMVKIGNLPVLEHLLNIFKKYDEFEFLICSGYLGEVIEDYFSEFKNVKIVDTGIETNTGGRIVKIKKYLNESFIVTYGDGLANVNISNLIKFHQGHKKKSTITVTNPISRFGLVKFNKENLVNDFVEKPKLPGYVNIGFMVFQKDALEYFEENSVLELEPLKRLVADKELKAFVHEGYFEPMDTYREYLHMNELWNSGSPPWV